MDKFIQNFLVNGFYRKFHLNTSFYQRYNSAFFILKTASIACMVYAGFGEVRFLELGGLGFLSPFWMALIIALGYEVLKYHFWDKSLSIFFGDTKINMFFGTLAITFVIGSVTMSLLGYERHNVAISPPPSDERTTKTDETYNGLIEANRAEIEFLRKKYTWKGVFYMPEKSPYYNQSELNKDRKRLADLEEQQGKINADYSAQRSSDYELYSAALERHNGELEANIMASKYLVIITEILYMVFMVWCFYFGKLIADERKEREDEEAAAALAINNIPAPTPTPPPVPTPMPVNPYYFPNFYPPSHLQQFNPQDFVALVAAMQQQNVSAPAPAPAPEHGERKEEGKTVLDEPPEGVGATVAPSVLIKETLTEYETRTCAKCGGEFKVNLRTTTSGGQGKAKKYCSDTCSKNAKIDRIYLKRQADREKKEQEHHSPLV